MTAPRRKSKVPLTADDERHGTTRGYSAGCRCQPCRTAITEYVKQKAAEAKQKGLAPDDERHGTSSGRRYWGCGCKPCIDAARADAAFSARQAYARKKGQL